MNAIAKIIEQQEIVIHNRQGAVVEIKETPKSLTINGEEHQLNAIELARMVRNVTQQIGHHKKCGSAYSSYMLHSLRTMRNEMVSDLEHHFRIGHVIDDSGKSVFYKLGREEKVPLMSLPKNQFHNRKLTADWPVPE